MRRRLALLSVSDKTGIVQLAEALVARGYELLSTGGTARALSDAGIHYVAVSDYTGFPEIFGGRVKTLHPRVHGGILGRRDTDGTVAERLGISWIDVVVVNLYPFAETVASGADDDGIIEQIDVGGPTMVRAAAKNHHAVTIVVDPADYALLVHADPDADARRRLATKAFRHTAAYDAQIAAWFGAREAALPDTLSLGLERVQHLRYGENPHQQAAFYASSAEGGRSLRRARQLQGKELSFNNLADLDAALRCVFDLDEPACVIVKHMNPCGAAVHPDGLAAAYRLALSADPVSAYGGIAVFNRPLSASDAETIHESKVFFEVVAAPGVEPGAEQIFNAKKNLRLMELPGDWAALKPEGWDARRIQGGWLVQTWDAEVGNEWRAVVRGPTPEERRALAFAWAVCRNVKSNAIVLATHEGAGVVLNGVGAGQMSRVDSVRLAVQKARRPTAGCVMASDAFFPFADGVVVAAEAGVTAVVQPGGSIRDAEVIAAAAAVSMAMCLTDTRHFRH